MTYRPSRAAEAWSAEMEIPAKLIETVSEELEGERMAHPSTEDWIVTMKQEAVETMRQETGRETPELRRELEAFLREQGDAQEALEEIVLASRLLRRSGTMEGMMVTDSDFMP